MKNKTHLQKSSLSLTSFKESNHHTEDSHRKNIKTIRRKEEEEKEEKEIIMTRLIIEKIPKE